MEARLFKLKFAANLSREVHEQKITVNQLSERSGVSHKAILRYLTGHSMPTLRTTMILAEVLDISLYDLVDSDDFAEYRS